MAKATSWISYTWKIFFSWCRLGYNFSFEYISHCHMGFSTLLWLMISWKKRRKMHSNWGPDSACSRNLNGTTSIPCLRALSPNVKPFTGEFLKLCLSPWQLNSFEEEIQKQRSNYLYEKVSWALVFVFSISSIWDVFTSVFASPTTACPSSLRSRAAWPEAKAQS